MNKAILIGNIGKDPEILTINSGKKLAKFSLATTETYKNAQGEKVTNTEWHNIVAFDKLAEIVESYFLKGNKVMIEGKIQTKSYETKEGEKRYSTDILMNGFEFLTSNKSDSQPKEPEHIPDSNQDDDENPLPF